MSAPPLPDIFGNYVLGEDFVEVVSPAAIDWLPQTAGWAWAGAVLALLLARYAWRRLRHWYRNRYRREAAAKLQALRGADADEAWLVELNRLLKLTALVAYSRDTVARLSGADWIAFLNSRCPEPAFSPEQTDLLEQGVYRRAVPDASMRQGLLDASLRWVACHEAGR